MTAPTPPIAGFAAATTLNTSVYWYLHISGTAQGVAISQVLEGAVVAGVIANGTSAVNMVNGVMGWQISITDPANNTSFATQGDYIVLTTTSAGTITGIGLYNGPSGTYENPLFTDLFTT
jgi:hypothetical protein